MSLFEHLERNVKEPRHLKGIRHPVLAIVKAAFIALLAGKVNMEQIAAYIQTVWDEVNEPLGFTHWHPPDADTYRRVLSALEPDCLNRSFQDWLSSVLAEKTFDISVDGKACRGFQQGEDPRNTFMMLNVFVHDMQAAIAQWRVGEKAGEPTVLSAHLAELVEKYPGIRLFIGDAYFSGRNLCEAIRDLKKHYVVRIKGNQQAVEEAMAQWFKERVKKPDAVARPEKKRSDLQPVFVFMRTRHGNLYPGNPEIPGCGAGGCPAKDGKRRKPGGLVPVNLLARGTTHPPSVSGCGQEALADREWSASCERQDIPGGPLPGKESGPG